MPNYMPVSKELRKNAAGRPLINRYTEKSVSEICDRLYAWASTDKNRHRSLRYYLLLHENVSDDDHVRLTQRYPFYKETVEKARVFRADMLRYGLIEEKNALCKSLLPLVDNEYKAWKLECNKVQTQQLDLFNGKLSKVIDVIDEAEQKSGSKGPKGPKGSKDLEVS